MSARTSFTTYCLATLIAGIALPVTAQDDDVIMSAPVLVSTTGGGPKWETIKELRAAAEKGDADASFQYAQLLESGDQVEVNEDLALAFYRKAAVQDHPDAVFRLGKIAHDGLLGQLENYVRALELYERAARLGVPEGTYNVGAMHVSGRGTKRSYVEGLAWLLLAAEQGSDPNDSVAAVKERLKRRPDYIKRAENRLAGIKAELSSGPIVTAPTASPTKPAVVAPKPTIAPPMAPAPVNFSPAPTFPSFRPSAPSIGVPSISIPPPKPKPAPPVAPPPASTGG